MFLLIRPDLPPLELVNWRVAYRAARVAWRSGQRHVVLTAFKRSLVRTERDVLSPEKTASAWRALQ